MTFSPVSSRAILLTLLLVSPIDSFVGPFGVTGRHAYRVRSLYESKKDSFLDVEFEKVDGTESTATETEVSEQDPDDSSDSSPLGKSLLELSLDMDPQWKQARIPFVQGNEYIDCNLAFTVDMDDGITYGIGIPCDAAVAVTLEEGDKVTYMNPALEENEELIQIMASQLHELLGENVFLKKTPKILTISGDLDKYTDQWKDELFNETVSTDDLLDDSDEGLDFFYNFMKQELGEEEFQKTLDEAREDGGSSIDKEVLDLFNIPGLGDQADDLEGVEKMFQEMMQEQEEGAVNEEVFTRLGQDLEHEGVALKLIGFNFPRDGRSYSLVKLLKPFTIVGKYVKDDKDDLRFDLLTAEEEKLVIPRLEQLCREDLDQAGLSLLQG